MFDNWLHSGADIILSYLEIVSPIIWSAPPLLHNGVFVQPAAYADSFYVPAVCFATLFSSIFVDVSPSICRGSQ